MSLCQCLTQCICVNVLLLQFDIIKLFICIGKIVTIKMFSCIHELSPYHYQLSSCHHQLSSWYILTCILDIYLDTISLNNYNQIDYALDLSPLNLTCCSQGQSRNKKLALSQSTRSPSGFHYFSKSSFSKSILVTGLSVCLSVCLSVFKGSTGRTACPIVLIFFAKDVFWTRDNAELFFLKIG